MSRLLRTSAVIALAALTNCGGDPTGPSRFQGQYSLTAVNGTSLPAFRLPATVECDRWLVSGALSLLPDSLFVLADRDSLDCSRAGAPPSTSWNAFGGRYSVTGTQLELLPDDMVAGTQYVVTVQGDVLTLTTTAVPGFTFQTIYSYARIRN